MSYIVPVSLGELVDKITILEIKLDNITNKESIYNVMIELQSLKEISIPQIDTTELKKVNMQLWNVEDNLRKYEKEGYFGSHFIEDARSVYKLNDLRATLKKTINITYGSKLIEEKSY